MIKITRMPKPSVLSQWQTTWTDALLATEDDGERRKLEKRYRHRQIKDILAGMFHGKCAYCESKIFHIEYGHIEHFRPKSLFRALTFEWTNLLLSCPVCNGAEYKGDRFPEQSEGGPLVNPCEDVPDEHFEFVFDSHAKLATVISKTSRGAVTVELLGLNRNDLRAYRSHHVSRLFVLASYAKIDPAAKQLLDEACQDDCEYAAFSRAFAR